MSAVGDLPLEELFDCVPSQEARDLLVDAWQRHEHNVIRKCSLVCPAAGELIGSCHQSRAWLKAVGGVSFTEVVSCQEVVQAASSAPNNLLFGLTYGLYQLDIGRAACCAASRWPWGARPWSDGSLMYLCEKAIIHRGSDFIEYAQCAYPQYMSRFELTGNNCCYQLHAQIASAPIGFLLGASTACLVDSFV